MPHCSDRCTDLNSQMGSPNARIITQNQFSLKLEWSAQRSNGFGAVSQDGRGWFLRKAACSLSEPPADSSPRRKGDVQGSENALGPEGPSQTMHWAVWL